jgi:hypothetical protein
MDMLPPYQTKCTATVPRGLLKEQSDHCKDLEDLQGHTQNTFEKELLQDLPLINMTSDGLTRPQ